MNVCEFEKMEKNLTRARFSAPPAFEKGRTKSHDGFVDAVGQVSPNENRIVRKCAVSVAANTRSDIKTLFDVVLNAF